MPPKTTAARVDKRNCGLMPPKDQIRTGASSRKFPHEMAWCAHSPSARNAGGILQPTPQGAVKKSTASRKDAKKRKKQLLYLLGGPLRLCPLRDVFSSLTNLFTASKPLGLEALTPAFGHPLNRAGGRGEGEREDAFNPRLTPWAELCCSFGAELRHESLRQKTRSLRIRGLAL